MSKDGKQAKELFSKLNLNTHKKGKNGEEVISCTSEKEGKGGTKMEQKATLYLNKSTKDGDQD